MTREEVEELLRAGRAKELLARRVAGELFPPDCSRLDLRGADLYGASLEELDLYRSIFDDVDGRKSRLKAANLFGASLARARLERSILTYAILDTATLESANLEGADLSHCRARRANLRGADLTNARCVGADFRAACLRGARLTGTDFTDADLRLVDVDVHELRRAVLTRARFPMTFSPSSA